MHDPMTVAHEIKYPWRKYPKGSKMWPQGYRANFITIWHVDPESDGSDDSCGYSSPKPDDADRKLIDEAAKWEMKHPYYASHSVVIQGVVVDPKYQYKQLPPGDCLALTAAAWQHIAWSRDRRRHGSLTSAEWSNIVSLATNPTDNLRSLLADVDEKPEDRTRRFFHCVMRCYLRHHRRWYQHPKWHVWHWKIQIHPLQDLKRWAFSRCAGCGKRFAWGYCPSSNQWDGDGPSWFKGERDVFHSECNRAGKAAA